MRLATIVAGLRDVAEALERVEALGGSVVHPGQAWAICKDSEGSPFGPGAAAGRRVVFILAPTDLVDDHEIPERGRSFGG